MFDAYSRSSNTNNISFNSVQGIIIKTHPKSKIVVVNIGNDFYRGLKKENVLQMMLVDSERVVIEYLESDIYMSDIFGEDTNKITVLMEEKKKMLVPETTWVCIRPETTGNSRYIFKMGERVYVYRVSESVVYFHEVGYARMTRYDRMDSMSFDRFLSDFVLVEEPVQK